MRRSSWLLVAGPAWTAALVWAAGCGSDARGIEACRTIEYARCEAVQVCAEAEYTPPDVDSCKELYRDQCLHGVERPDGEGVPEPSGDNAEACAAAIAAVAQCKQAGAATMVDCAVEMSPGEDRAVSPCEVIRDRAHFLQACSFVAKPDGGTTGASATGGGGSGGSGGGGAGSGGGDAGAD